uniref:Reverse transcriptase domain-containing protein n=1 Tax=Tanacetum cinerariifolium TaxID=118510 RepID=A0A6L2KHY6_TANCI|nr:hypothetical protein [Tanacetum cinerariifolium]
MKVEKDKDGDCVVENVSGSGTKDLLLNNSLDQDSGNQNYGSKQNSGCSGVEILDETVSDADKKEYEECSSGDKHDASGGVNLGTLPNEKGDKVNDDNKHTETRHNEGVSRFKSYVGVTNNNIPAVDRKLTAIPTEMDDNGSEIVVFHEAMIAEGKYGEDMGLRKLLTIIMGSTSLSFTRMRGLIMWLIMDLGWVGKPLVMDHVTATMCMNGVCRFRFARVMVEVSASKSLPSEIELVYRNGSKEEICRKTMKVDYDWKPPMCSECCVFGHNNLKCRKQSGESIDSNGNMKGHDDCGKGTNDKQNKTDNESFTEELTSKQGGMGGKANSHFVYQPKRKDGSSSSGPPKKQKQNAMEKKEKPNEHKEQKETTPTKKAWSIHGELLTAMKRSANKYSVLEMYEEEEMSELNEMQNKEIVDKFISQKKIPTESEMLAWNIDMVAYYKQRMELNMSADKNKLEKTDVINEEEDDVFKDDSSMNMDDVLEVDKGEVRNFIRDECLNVCAIVETHIKAKRIQKVWELIYRRWDWYNKLQHCEELLIRKPGAWILMGDMNVTLFSNEHSTGCSHVTADMCEFRNCVNNIEVEDISSSGLFYTWTKNMFNVKSGDTSGVLKKLDRIMGNEEFINKFPNAHAIFLPYLIFDHSPNVIVLPNTLQIKKRSFKVHNSVADKAEFNPTILKHWNKEFEGCFMFKLVKKLKSRKRDLKQLTWKDGNIFDKVKLLRGQLREVQIKINKNPDSKQLREEERSMLVDYVEAMKDEENILFQKAKIKWLCLGDRNNSYFHKVLKSMMNRGRISQISDDKVQNLDGIGSLISHKLSTEDADNMVRDVSNEEIKSAMFSIDINKAPGPDGFSSHFFKKAWSTVGKDVCQATGLGKIVDLNQSAFVPNRHIQDNILLSQEILKGYDRKDGPKRIAIKIDIQKAYDAVNWQFLEAMLVGFGFYNKMVNWIIKCVTTASFSICVNGERFGYFKGGRGLRQGDHMSPYLFTMVMEILTLIVKQKVEESTVFKYHFGCKMMKLAHICFVDDLLMFYHGDMDSIMVLKKAIEEFGGMSGLLPNYNKSTIIFGCMKENDKQYILRNVPFKVEKLPVKYLGVPLTSKRLSVSNCKSLLDKIKNRVMNWKNKCLSYAGRLQLIASVLESIHVYWSSVFLLPQTVINEINKILKGFMWSQDEFEKGKAKVAWKNICRPKSQGGLGLKDLGVWNKAMIAKLLWHLATNKQSLWVKWVNVVKLKGRSIWVVNEETFITHRDLYNVRWKDDIVLKDIMMDGVWQWPDIWIDKYPQLNSLNSIALGNLDDELVWRSIKGKEGRFTVKQAYNDLRSQDDKVAWGRLV